MLTRPEEGAAPAAPGEAPAPVDLEAYWRSADFREASAAWISAALARHGRQLRGAPAEHRVRFWSAVFTVPTDGGTVWFKATNPGQGFEAPLLARLAALLPGRVLAPLAVDAGLGWLLMPDGGPTLASRDPVALEDWGALLAECAGMQIALTGTDLTSTGLPDLLAGDAEGYVAWLVAALAGLPRTHLQHLDAGAAQRILRALPAAARGFAALENTGIAPTLQPNDVSASNAFVGPAGGLAPFRLFDLGDAFWSHPFAAFQVPVRMATGSWPHAPAADDPVRARLEEAYLRAWSHVAPVAELRPVLVAADRLASLHRAESWRRLLARTTVAGAGTSPPPLGRWLEEAVGLR
ncbi:hypothetical protein [Georgenia faecalis]|uniref:hypothetical protein n=1 Tax=Georgenia faecalis TaxID=2483799 RepID=UPI000FD6EB37|nr:hypothetical protein [Georgenia faecalis]